MTDCQDRLQSHVRERRATPKRWGGGKSANLVRLWRICIRAYFWGGGLVVRPWQFEGGLAYGRSAVEFSIISIKARNSRRMFQTGSVTPLLVHDQDLGANRGSRLCWRWQSDDVGAAWPTVEKILFLPISSIETSYQKFLFDQKYFHSVAPKALKALSQPFASWLKGSPSFQKWMNFRKIF